MDFAFIRKKGRRERISEMQRTLSPQGTVRKRYVENGIMYGIFNMNVTHIFSIVVIFNKYV